MRILNVGDFFRAFFDLLPWALLSAVLSAVLNFSGCSTAKKIVPPSPTGSPGQPKIVTPTAAAIEIIKATKDQTALIAHPLTSFGDNRGPRFSPDGAKILFLSSARPSHRHTQVYELDLLRMTERRVTFHDGDDEGANWDTNSRIVYASVTDELKEDVSLEHIKAAYDNSTSTSANPAAFHVSPRSTDGGNIYRQRLDGRAIQRLTLVGPDHSPTADSSPSSSKSSRIVFVSSRLKEPGLYIYKGSTARRLSRGLDRAPAFSFDGQALAWERPLSGPESKDDSKSPGQSQIVMTARLSESSNPGSALTAPGFRDQQPAWSAKGDSVIFSSNRGGKTFDLYLVNRAGTCMKRLTDLGVDLLSPTMSPDGSKIAFTSKVNGQNQIFIMEDRSVSLPCVTVPAVKP